MATIDYTSYSNEQLIEVKENMSSEHHPENYQALEREIASRGNDEEEDKKYREINIERNFILAEKRVKIIGYFQLAAALGITSFLLIELASDSTYVLTSQIVGWLLVLLNVFAGITAIRENYRWYWLSILNQALQLPSVAFGSIMANYSGLGGIYATFYWGEQNFGIDFSASFSPGFSFLEMSESLTSGRFSIDALAVLFATALITVREKKLDTNGLA